MEPSGGIFAGLPFSHSVPALVLAGSVRELEKEKKAKISPRGCHFCTP